METGVQIILALGGSIVGVVILLTLFFKLANKLGSGEADAKSLKIRGIVSDKTRVTVHLGNNTVYEDVLVVGFTQSEGACSGGALPYELSGMTILEHVGGARTIIQSKLIRIIEIPAPTLPTIDENRAS